MLSYVCYHSIHHNILKVLFSFTHNGNCSPKSFIISIRLGKYLLGNLNLLRSFHTIYMEFSCGEYAGRESRNSSSLHSSSHGRSSFAWWYFVLSRMICIFFLFLLFIRTIRNFRMLLPWIYLPHFNEFPALTFTAPNTLIPFMVGYCNTVGSLSSGGIHMANLVPCW